MAEHGADIFALAKRAVTRGFIEANFACPESKWQGDEFITLNPLRPDNKIGSFSIRSDGTYNDYAVPGCAGDIITLLSEREGMKPYDVALYILGRDKESKEKNDNNNPDIGLTWVPIPEGQLPKFKEKPDYLTTYHVNDMPAFMVVRHNTLDEVGNPAKLIYPVFWTGSVFQKGMPKGMAFRPLASFDDTKTVVIVEGEKCYEEARKAIPEYSWTTWHGGASVIKKVDIKPLYGLDVIVWPDNDEPGARAADELVKALAGIASSIRRVIIPSGKQKKWDVADALNDSTDILELLEESILLETADSFIDMATFTEPKPAAERPFTDLGNAERFIDMWGHVLRFNVDKQKWLVWNGNLWTDKDQSIVNPLVKRTIRSMATDDKRMEAIFWAKKTEGIKYINAMLSLGSKERGIPVSENDLDAHHYIINTPSGMVDLRTGELKAPDPAFLCSKSTLASYDSKAYSPKWAAFLKDTFEGDDGVINFIQRWVGYSLTGDVSAQTFAIFHGVGANGKSTLVETIQQACGDYVKTAPPDTFIQKQAGGIPNDIAALRGARMVLTTETEANAKLAEAKVKSMTGGDRLSARFMRGEFFEFTPTHKITISTNHRPRISGGDYGIWRRVVLVPFNNIVPVDKQNPRLIEELLAEKDGILSWCVKGAQMWYQSGGGRLGLQVPDSVYAETQEYREDEDVIGRFLIDGCMKKKDLMRMVQTGQLVHDRCQASTVYYSFVAWAEKEGEHYFAKMTQNMFGRALRERGYIPERTSLGKQYKGIIPLDVKHEIAERSKRDDLFDQ